jgi:hypothetical protein
MRLSTLPIDLCQIYAESTKVIRQQDGDTTISQEIYVLRGGFGQFQALYKASPVKMNMTDF